jgi:hypothetical protein
VHFSRWTKSNVITSGTQDTIRISAPGCELEIPICRCRSYSRSLTIPRYYSSCVFFCNRGRYGEGERGTKHEAQCSFAQAFRVDNSVVAQLERCGGMASLNVVRYFLAESHWQSSHIRADSMKSPTYCVLSLQLELDLPLLQHLVCPYIR